MSLINKTALREISHIRDEKIIQGQICICLGYKSELERKKLCFFYYYFYKTYLPNKINCSIFVPISMWENCCKKEYACQQALIWLIENMFWDLWMILNGFMKSERPRTWREKFQGLKENYERHLNLIMRLSRVQ